jgi:dTDP-4-dehydrorhamnose reductase
MTGILVFGQSGQVARALAGLSTPALPITTMGRAGLDLNALDEIAPAIERVAPFAVINASGHTAVDAAESDEAAAIRLNCDAPAAMARACAELDLPFVHISTDFVFDGEKGAPYVESDPLHPLSAYGRSKAAGEAAVAEVGERWAIVRTSWVYDATGKNFVRTMLRLAAERNVLRVVADQRGRPTFAEDLAAGLLEIARAQLAGRAEAQGLFHYCNSGDATWADLAEAALAGSAARGGPRAKVERITTADYPTPARRPRDSRLDCARYTALTGKAPPAWRDSLVLCLNQIYR